MLFLYEKIPKKTCIHRAPAAQVAKLTFVVELYMFVQFRLAKRFLGTFIAGKEDNVLVIYLCRRMCKKQGSSVSNSEWNEP